MWTHFCFSNNALDYNIVKQYVSLWIVSLESTEASLESTRVSPESTEVSGVNRTDPGVNRCLEGLELTELTLESREVCLESTRVSLESVEVSLESFGVSLSLWSHWQRKHNTNTNHQQNVFSFMKASCRDIELVCLVRSADNLDNSCGNGRKYIKKT